MHTSRSQIVGYALALLLVAAYMGLRHFAAGVLGREGMLLLGLMVVGGSAWMGGLGPGLLAAGLTTAVAGYMMVGRTATWNAAPAIGIYAGVAIGITCVIAGRSRIQRLTTEVEQLKSADAERARMLLEMREVNESLRVSEERYRLVSRVTDEAVWDYDVLAGRIQWTRGLQRVFRYKPEHITPTVEWHKARIHPDDRDRVLRGLEQAFVGGREAWSDEYRFLRGDNTYATVLDRGSIVRSDKGTPVRMIGSMMDITSLKDAERALQDSQRFLQRLVRTVPALIVLTDSKGQIVLYNRACEELTGRKRRDVLGKSVMDLFLDSEQAVAFRKRFADPFAPEVREPHEMSWRTMAGDTRLIEWRWTVLPPPDGGLPYFLGTGIDITDRKAAEEALHRAKEEAEKNAEAAHVANDAKNKFLAVLSHELRTPLAPVLMSASMLRRRADLSREVLGEIEMIHRNLQIEVMLIDDLLDLTRMARGELGLHLAPTDAHEVLRHALEVCAPDIRHKRLRLNVQCDAEHHVVTADPTRLQQVFWNLLKNSVAFTPEGGVVSVRTGNGDMQGTEAPRHVGAKGEAVGLSIEISHTGLGIAQEDVQRLFDAFERGPDLHEERGGMSLNLSIARALGQAQGATVQAHSEGPNQGATFTVELAADLESKVGDLKPENPNPKSKAQNSPALRLLLIEDHEDTLRALSRLLRSLGHSVAIARDKSTALSLAQRETFDLVISDLALPDGSALDLMPQLREKHNLRGIALSGYGMDADIRQSRAAGFDQHLTKPIDFAQLQSALEELACEVMPGRPSENSAG